MKTFSSCSLAAFAGTTASILVASLMVAAPASAAVVTSITSCTLNGQTSLNLSVNYGDEWFEMTGVSVGGDFAWLDLTVDGSLEYSNESPVFPSLGIGYQSDLAGKVKTYAWSAVDIADGPVYSRNGGVLCSVTITYGPEPGVNYGHSGKTADKDDRARDSFTADPPSGAKPKKK
jgi:hypothetical protein